MPILCNIRQSVKDFILRFSLDNPDWKKRLDETNKRSHAQGVYMVRNELTGESVGVVMLSEVLKEIL